VVDAVQKTLAEDAAVVVDLAVPMEAQPERRLEVDPRRGAQPVARGAEELQRLVGAHVGELFENVRVVGHADLHAAFDLVRDAGLCRREREHRRSRDRDDPLHDLDEPSPATLHAHSSPLRRSASAWMMRRLS
jgi:hypothetical protein